MLEDLSTVDWSSIQDAHGRAGDVPRLLRAGAASGELALAAIRELADRVDHQGSPSPAALPAVPFLWELARGTHADAQCATLVLLANLAVGGHHQNFLGTGLTDASPAYVLLRREPGSSLRAAVSNPAADALALLGDATPRVRAAAGFLVAVTAPAGAVAALAQALSEEKHAATLADLAISLGFLLVGATTTERTKPLAALRKLLAKKDVVRSGAAIALGLADDMDPTVGEALLSVVAGESRGDVIWNEGHIAAHATQVLLGRTRGDGQVTTLGRLLDTAPASERGEVATVLLGRAFENAVAGRIDPSSLDDTQKAVLRLFQSRDDLYQGSRSPHALLEQLGLPYLPWELGALLGDPAPPAGALDRMIVVRDEKKTVREHWLAAAQQHSDTVDDVARAIAEQLPPKDAVAAGVEGVQLKVGWGRKSNELCVLVLAAAGPEGAPAIGDAIRVVEAKGPPKLWAHGPLGARALGLGQLLLVGWAAAAKVSAKDLSRLSKNKHFSAPSTLTGLTTSPEVGPRAKQIVEAYLALVESSALADL